MQKNEAVSSFFRRPGVGSGVPAEKLYDVKDGWTAYILAGGTSGIKTALLRSIREQVEAAGERTETALNGFDADSIDGLRIPARRVYVLDGTRFGGYVPACPGLGERVIGLDDCLDLEKLEPYRARILVFHARQLADEDRAGQFLSAAGSLLTDNTRIALECADLQKLDAVAARMASRLFPQEKRKGTESIRLLTSVTADGVRSFCAQAAEQFAHVYILEDEYGIGRLFLSRLRDAALKAGQDVISCPCPLFQLDQPEHLLVPGASAAIFTSCRFHPVEGYRHIHIRRFLDYAALSGSRARMSFNRKAAREFLSQASRMLAEARENRRTAETFYQQALKPQIIDAIAANLSLAGQSAVK